MSGAHAVKDREHVVNGHHATNGHRPAPPPTPVRPPERTATKRTLLALLATALGVVPLKGLLSDTSWLIDVWLTMLIVIGPAALIRLRREPGALDIWPGVILLVPWLTARFVPDHAWGGLIPHGGTWHDISMLITDLHHTTRDEVAPTHSTVAVRLVLCALLGLLAALIDLIAVVGRRGALAGVPLLIVYTVSGAVPRKPVSWYWFVLAAVAFLILLALDSSDDLNRWGRRIAPPTRVRSRSAFAVSAQRVAVIAVAAAVLLPALVPDHARNLIADAFHSGGKGGGGTGLGDGGGSISPFVQLRGDLNRSIPIDLMQVHFTQQPGNNVQPFYLRSNVLPTFTGGGWIEGKGGTTESIESTAFGTSPPTDVSGDRIEFEAQLSVEGLTGPAPVFALPIGVDGLSSDTRWSPTDQLLSGGSVHRGDHVTEEIVQPSPSVARLEQAPAGYPRQLDRMLALPSGMPSYVRDLVDQLTRGKSGPYAKALAISNYFADPDNGFVYSLQTKAGDSGSDLVDFLKNKQGFCQQYAAAMGVMLRLAGVPARVVLGYMHDVPDGAGNVTITTDDAHAWVEAYFIGIGWVPFDPTPIAGLVGGKANDLTYAPHAYDSSGSSDSTSPSQRASGRQASVTDTSSTPAAAAPANSGGGSSGHSWWIGLLAGALVLLGLTPALIRTGRRRRRYLAGRRGDADALWAELADSAVDLGYAWSPARSPRQVAAWLARDTPGAATELAVLAGAVEQRRYARVGALPARDGLVGTLRDALGQLRTRRSARSRLRATLWPASLGWGRWPGRGRRQQ